MGIEVASSFTRKAAVPLDDAFAVNDLTARDAIISGVRFEGMLCYVKSDQTMYQLKGGITNSHWAEAGGSAGANLIRNKFSGNGSTTAFTLSIDPLAKENTSVFIHGVYQGKDTYSMSGTTMTFTQAPPTGTDNVEVMIIVPMSSFAIPDGSVTPIKMASPNKTSSAVAANSYIDNTEADVASLTTTITVSGQRPVLVFLEGVSANSLQRPMISLSKGSDTTVTSCALEVYLYKDNNYHNMHKFRYSTGLTTAYTSFSIPLASVLFYDYPTSGTYTYKLRGKTTDASTADCYFDKVKLTAMEL